MATVSRPPRARGVVLPFPHGRDRGGELARLLPSGRALLVAFGVLAAAALAYLGARETPLFAVRRIEVVGAPARVGAHVRRTLTPLQGESLLALNRAAIARRLEALPDVADATYDRDFPHTLRVFVEPERAVAVVRRGPEAWVVSIRGRIIRAVSPVGAPRLARIWIAKSADVSVGARLQDPEGARALSVLAAVHAARFPARVRLVRPENGRVSLILASGLELRLGDPSNLSLKLAIARRIVPLLGRARYLDVSVPERPVAE